MTQEINDDVFGMVFDEDNIYSVINVSSDALKRSFELVDRSNFELSEKELRRHINPTATDQALRISFWREYARVVSHRRRNKTSEKVIYCASVFTGICSDAYFYNNFMKSAPRLCWMITPLPNYMAQAESILNLFWGRMDEIANIPFTKLNRKGEEVIDEKALRLFIDTFKYIEDRVKGKAVSKRLSINKNLTEHEVIPVEVEETLSIEEMDTEIQKLEGELHGQSGNDRGNESGDDRDISDSDDQNNGGYLKVSEVCDQSDDAKLRESESVPDEERLDALSQGCFE